MTPRWLSRRSDIDPAAKDIYALLLLDIRYSPGATSSRLTFSEMQENIGLTRSKIRRHLAELEQHGLIRRTDAENGKGGVIHVLKDFNGEPLTADSNLQTGIDSVTGTGTVFVTGQTQIGGTGTKSDTGGVTESTPVPVPDPTPVTTVFASPPHPPLGTPAELNSEEKLNQDHEEGTQSTTTKNTPSQKPESLQIPSPSPSASQVVSPPPAKTTTEWVREINGWLDQNNFDRQVFYRVLTGWVNKYTGEWVLHAVEKIMLGKPVGEPASYIAKTLENYRKAGGPEQAEAQHEASKNAPKKPAFDPLDMSDPKNWTPEYKEQRRKWFEEQKALDDLERPKRLERARREKEEREKKWGLVG